MSREKRVCINIDSFIFSIPILALFTALVKPLLKSLLFHDFYLYEKVVLTICSR